MPPNKVAGVRTFWGKMLPVLTSDPDLLPQLLDTCRQQSGPHIKVYSYKIRISNYFTLLSYFIKTERLKKNEKTEKCISNERVIKIPEKNPNKKEIIYQIKRSKHLVIRMLK